jgi:putative FmdB family regulatory protein
MPIYEFYCPDCHRVYSFLSRLVAPERRPACPRCGRRELTRRVSLFAISKGRKEEPAAAAGEPAPDDARLERAMQALASEAEGMNEEDPRQSARLMRKLFGATGVPVTGRMEEALKRLEAGESPDRVEEEMGDVFENDPFGEALAGAEAAPEAGRGLTRLARRLTPPTVDPELYEM